ncbi:DoxX family membrane protein [Flavobacteriaceae bacterium]|nr:DoxX family membrane protein [Flavobacteriaceae bacterium]
MKVLVGVSRIFVGVLFIISGLIKLNDPVGFSFKLGDYFAPEVLNLPFLEPYALVIAVLVVILEVLLGVMLIVGYAKKFTLWSLLLMIVFFTFLTFYSAYFNKVTDCGCFGDALKLTPWESFSKDVVLLVLILVLYKGSRYIQPFFSKGVRSITVFISLILCLWLGLHVLEHLPVIDFRAYKVGKNITKGMQTPANAPRAVYQYNWSFDVNGQQKTVINRGEDPKIDGTLLGVETSVLQKGYEPPIHDFSIERDGIDYTTQMLEEENLLVVIAYNLDVAQNDGFVAIKKVTDTAIEKGYTVIGISASSTPETEKLAAKYDLDFKFYFCDMTALKTIIRSNPSIMSLEKGTILQKLHFNDVDQLKLKTLKNTSLTNDIPVKTLDSIN